MPVGSAATTVGGAQPHRYTIADLERETGISPRNIRYYITQGLLPPANGRGVGATYTAEHLLRLQYVNKLKQDNLPLVSEPQVYLRDGQMQIYGKAQRGMFNANVGVIVTVGVDAEGQPDIEIVSADFGPLPAPEGLKETIEAMVREAYTGSLGPVATGLRIETISIANGIMTVTGRIR